MTHLRRLAPTLALLAAAGCAATYAPSPRMQTLQASLDKKDAAQIFAKALTASPAASGLCRAAFRWDDARPAATPDAFSLQAWRPGEELGREKQSGTTLVTVRKDRYVVERRFGELEKIRISKDVPGSCYAPAVRGQAAITLHDGRVEVPIVLAVAADQLDAVLAALSVLAPRAKLIEGAGL